MWRTATFKPPALWRRGGLWGGFYVADITDWDMIMGYDFHPSRNAGPGR